MPENWFGEDVAATYDEGLPPLPDAGIDLLAELAGTGGAALEIAVGTGRVALALAARGVRVSGLELSEAMVARLQAKPGGDEASIPVVVGDMATATVAGVFDVVYLVFNTIGNLTSQDAQVACFANAARHLRPGGTFVVETSVPALRLLPPGQRHVVFEMAPDHVGVDEYAVATQGLVSHHTVFRGDGGVQRVSVPSATSGPPSSTSCPPGGDAAARPLGRLEQGPLHRRQRRPRVGVGDGVRRRRSPALDGPGPDAR